MKIEKLAYELLVYWKQPEFIEAVKKSLQTLNARERFVIEKRYGLTGEEPKTLDETAALLKPVSPFWRGNAQSNKGVTRERARQLEAKAMRRLRHPSRLNPVLQAIDLMKWKPTPQPVKPEIIEDTIDVLFFPTRIYNMLRHYNIKTVEETRKVVESGEIYKFRQAGLRTVLIIAEALKVYYDAEK